MYPRGTGRGPAGDLQRAMPFYEKVLGVLSVLFEDPSKQPLVEFPGRELYPA